MKSTSALALFLVIFSSFCQAQDKSGFVAYSVGPSIPIGDLASKNFNKAGAGFAKIGVMQDLTFSHLLGGGIFGITGLLRWQENAIDNLAYLDEFVKIDPKISWSVGSKNWKMLNTMIGGFGKFRISENSSFIARAMFGFTIANSPEITILGSHKNGGEWIDQRSSTATSLSYILGAGFKFDMKRNTFFLTNVDLLNANPEFRNVEIHADDGNISKYTFNQKIGIINLSIGLGVNI